MVMHLMHLFVHSISKPKTNSTASNASGFRTGVNASGKSCGATQWICSHIKLVKTLKIVRTDREFHTSHITSAQTHSPPFFQAKKKCWIIKNLLQYMLLCFLTCSWAFPAASYRVHFWNASSQTSGKSANESRTRDTFAFVSTMLIGTPVIKKDKLLNSVLFYCHDSLSDEQILTNVDGIASEVINCRVRLISPALSQWYWRQTTPNKHNSEKFLSCIFCEIRSWQ